MTTKLKAKNGFSLTEMVIYVGILVFMLVVIVNVLISVNRSARTLTAARSTETSASLTLERLTREIRATTAINTAQSTFDSHPGKLSLSTLDPDGSEHIVEFSFSNGAVQISKDGVSLGALTRSDSTVTKLIFRRFVGDNSEGVRTELSLESGTSTSFRHLDMYATSVTRNQDE